MVAGAVPAFATSLQTTIMSPLNSGTVTSNPDEPHHRPFGGDWSEDLAAAGGSPVYARFANASGSLALNVAGTFEPCAPPNQGRGGVGVTIEVRINGTLLGNVKYLHLSNVTQGSGPIGNGAQIGTVMSGQAATSCWGGPHVHIEPINISKYSCWLRRGLGSGFGSNSAMGVIGGEYASGVNQACPAGAENGSTVVAPELSVSPSVGDKATLFQGSGSRFTPNSTVSAKVIQPDGAEYGAAYTRSRAVNSAGNFSWTWVWDPGDQFGTYTYIATDAGGASTQINFTINAPDLTPTVAVSPSTGDRTTIFSGTGEGFSSNAAVDVKVLQPDGSEYSGTYTRTRTTNGGGAFNWTWVWDPGDPFGTYTFVATDQTGPSARTSFSIDAPSQSDPAPLLGFDTASAPNEDTMRAWLGSPYRSVGVYLPVGLADSDNRADKVQASLSSTWVQNSRSMGWSIVPIYLGKQAPASCFPADYWHMASEPLLAWSQGVAAANDAINSMATLDLPGGSPIYYDMEAYNSGCAETVKAYLNGWSGQLHARGYVAGVYGSRGSVMNDLVAMVSQDGSSVPDAVWVATNNGSTSVRRLGVPPDGLWSGPQRINQYDLNVTEAYGGKTLTIDANAVDAPVVPPIAPQVAGAFGALAPSRVLDTRVAVGALGSAGPAGSISVQVAGRGGVPSTGVAAVVMNVTAVNPSGDGFITAWASGADRPNASNLNFYQGRTVPNLVVVPVGSDGKIQLFNGSGGRVDLLADVAGYYLSS